MRKTGLVWVAVFMTVCILVSSCAVMKKVHFPAADDIFMTTGDGDIQKPYTPVGQLLFYKTGFRIPFPLLGLIPLADVDPDLTLKQDIYREVREMGGDAVINLRIDWTPASSGVLGMFAHGGRIAVYGTVIRR